MISPQAFIRKYQPVWIELEQKLSGNPLEIAGLYRQVTSHLSFARTYFPDHEVTKSLNALAGRAHLVIYGKKGGEWRSVGRFFTWVFPDALIRAMPFFLVSCAIMLFGILAGYIAVTLSPDAIYALLPASFIQQFHPAQAGPHLVNAPIMSSLIMTNNIRVSIYAFLGAFTLGALTIWSLYYNGLLLGALAAVFAHANRSLIFFSLIVPHGVTELTAIGIAGASGLMVSYRFLVPGKIKRSTSLSLAAMDAAKLLFGVMVMLVIAGTIEGFVTPSYLPVAVKYGIGLITAAFWITYFWFSSRDRSASKASL